MSKYRKVTIFDCGQSAGKTLDDDLENLQRLYARSLLKGKYKIQSELHSDMQSLAEMSRPSGNQRVTILSVSI